VIPPSTFDFFDHKLTTIQRSMSPVVLPDWSGIVFLMVRFMNKKKSQQ